MELKLNSPKAAFSGDVKALLAVVAVFNWTAFLLLSRTALLDFIAFFTAGFLITNGRGENLFDYRVQQHFQSAVLGQPGTLPFYHPAYEALLFAPLSLLPFNMALWIWRLVLAFAVMGVWFLMRKIFSVGSLEALLLILSFMSTALAFAQGQDSLVLLLLFTAAFWALLRDLDLLSGGLLTLGLFKPQLVLPIAFLVGWKRGRMFTIGASVGAIMVIGTSTAVTGTAGWSEWLLLIREAASSHSETVGAPLNTMANLRGLLDGVLLNGEVAQLASVFCGAGLFFVTMWKLKPFSDPRRYFPPAVAMAVLVSYHLQMHDIVLCLIPVFSLIASKAKPIPVQLCLGSTFALPIFLMAGVIPFFSLVIIALWAFTVWSWNASPS